MSSIEKLSNTADIVNESVTTSPLKPSCSRNNPVMILWDKVVGYTLSYFVYNTWLAIIPGKSCSTASLKGTSSILLILSKSKSTLGSPIWESTAVSPWPGKCLIEVIKPASV